MTHFNPESRESLMHLAECAAHLTEAAAVAVEEGGGESINLHAAIRSISDPHECHVDAAIYLLARILYKTGGNVTRWRDEIPNMVAIIASGCPA